MAKYDEFGGEIAENGGAEVDEFGGEIAKPPTAAAPVQAAQTSISQAFNAPAPGKGGVLSDVGDYFGEALQGFGAGAAAGFPFGLGPSIVGTLTGQTTEDVQREIEEARKKSPIAFGTGEFGSEVSSTFVPGAGLGSKLVTKAAPALTRAFPILSKAPGALEAALKGLGLGTVTGTEAAGRALVEGAPVGEALKTGAKTGGAMAALPATFAAAPAVVGAIPGAGPISRGLASTVAPLYLAAESAPFEREEGEILPTLTGDAADVTKWALTQGMMLGGDPLLKAATGPKAAYERAAASSRERIQPKLRRAEGEGMELARGDIYGAEARREVAMGQVQKAEQARQVQREVNRRLETQRRANVEQQIVEEQRKGEYKARRAEEIVRNRQFRNAVRNEQRAMATADRLMQGDVSAVDRLAQDALDLDTLVKGLETGSDPSLRGLLGKLFQDVSNRLIRAKQALANRPELADRTLVEKINTVDRLIDESYLKNTQAGGYLEDFNDDPYARLEGERQARLLKARTQQDALAFKQAELLGRINSHDYLGAAREGQKGPSVPEERLRELASEAGLEFKGTDEQYGQRDEHDLKLAPSSAVAPVGRDVALARKLEQKTRGQVLDDVLSERRLSAAPDIANVTGETPLQAAVRRLRALPEGDRRRVELEAQVKNEFERQVAAGGNLLQGRAPEVDYGEKPPFFDPLNPRRETAVFAPKLPDWVKPAVAGRIAAGVFRGTAKAPQSKFTEVQEATNPLRPTQATLERPYNAVAMLRAWDKVLERPSDATRSVLARIADRMGITPDKLIRTTAYRAAALEQALKEPKVRDEVLSAIPPAP